MLKPVNAMKKFVFLSIAIAFAFAAQSQTLTTIYQFKDPTAKKTRDRWMKWDTEQAEKVYAECSKILEFKLVNSRGQSRFTFIKDTAQADSKADSPWIKRMRRQIEDITVYKNFVKDSYEYRVNLGLQMAIVTDSLKAPDWIITAEKKHIGGYEVTRARMPDDRNPKDTVVAWFAAAIPTFDGPLDYWGLPGLILELQSPRAHLIAKEIRFEKRSTSIKPLDKRGVRMITRNKFLALLTNRRH